MVMFNSKLLVITRGYQFHGAISSGTKIFRRNHPQGLAKTYACLHLVSKLDVLDHCFGRSMAQLRVHHVVEDLKSQRFKGKSRKITGNHRFLAFSHVFQDVSCNMLKLDHRNVRSSHN